MATIKCKNCGADVLDTMRFCTRCGTQVDPAATATASAAAGEQAAAALSKLKKFSLPKIDFQKHKRLAIIVAAVVLVAVVGIGVLAATSGAKYERVKGAVHILRGDENVVVAAGRNKSGINGYYVGSAESFDGTKAAVLVAEGSNYDDERSLYMIDGIPQKIVEGVSSFWLAASGDAVAYTIEQSQEERKTELWLYADGKNTRLSTDFYEDGNVAISPNGKAVAFVVADGDRHTGVVWDGKTNELGRDIQPLAISDNARYIYYTRSGSFYVQKGYNEQTREKLGEGVYSVYANKDLSQVVYNSDSKAYISRKGGSKEALSGSFSSFIFPQGTSKAHVYNGVHIYGISNFANTFYLNSDSAIVRINGKYETASIARRVSGAALANDGKTLTYLRNDSIFKVNGLAAEAEATQIVNDDAVGFIATADGKAVFFINDDLEFYYQKGNNKPVLVADAYVSYALFKGKTLFYVIDDELYESSGARGKRVSGFSGYVENVVADMFAVHVYTDDDGDTLVYRSTNGNSFEQVIRRE